MRRRGNKSSKVPGVKLRPAEKGAYKLSGPSEESCWAQDTQPGSDDVGLVDLCPRPLKSVVICATGVADKPTIFKQAVELGATCTPAFTDRVTHLVAEEHGGAKYMCALERKIPIVKPSWITENYQVWLRGDDVDISTSVAHHRLPIFSGVVICPSGITDITRRTQIAQLITSHGGTYLKDLTRPVRVTHLLCSGDEETDKMRYAEKFNGRGEARIHLVWEEWFWDSVDFGGRFEEGRYAVRGERPERRAVVEGAAWPPSSAPEECEEAPSSSLSAAKGKALPTAEEMVEDEPAFMNVLPSVTLQLWGALLSRRGYQITDGEVILSPTKTKIKKTASPSPAAPLRTYHELDGGFEKGGSVISAFRRTNSFAPALHPKDKEEGRQMPFRRTASSAAAIPVPVAGPSKQVPLQPQAGPSGSGSMMPSRIFEGMRVRALGEARSANVRQAVEERGGRMVSDEEEEVDFVIVRLVSGSKLYKAEESETMRTKYRTECWLEQCIYEERLCAAAEHVSHVPLGISIPIPGAERVVVSLSGFEQSETCALKRLFRALGITLSPTFSRRSTHLLCPSGTGLKFDKAREWGVPVVGLGWVGEVVRVGSVLGVEGFLVGGEGVDKKGKARDKGEGGAEMDMMVDCENRMNDITNNTPPDAVDRPASMAKPKLPIERQPTTLIPHPDPPEAHNHSISGPGSGVSFGPAIGVLGRGSSSYIPHPSSIVSPSRSMASLAIVQYGPTGDDGETFSFTAKSSRGESFDVGIGGLSNALASGSNHNYQGEDLNGENDDTHERIPSSKSPSPMKSLRRVGSTSSTRQSLSPVKIDCEKAKALQESITSLLGKRPSPDEEAGGIAVEGAGGAGVNGRNGKRARPTRSKPQTRQSSDAKIAQQRSPPPKPAPKPRKSTTSKRSRPLADALMNPFDSYSHENEHDDDNELLESGAKGQDESVRVMYEDPGQRDEKKRLMSLLKGGSQSQSQQGQGQSEGRTRRSTRIAGF
ncbi:hypothetical protein B0H34DRAFT_160966 [Crassisporium funariophilum]|nr:hypothetical protein B0H34DRAFT_160966 [Crassisporium funariophilum]